MGLSNSKEVDIEKDIIRIKKDLEKLEKHIVQFDKSFYQFKKQCAKCHSIPCYVNGLDARVTQEE